MAEKQRKSKKKRNVTKKFGDMNNNINLTNGKLDTKITDMTAMETTK